jgi:osmotically-inducible protein OsmY
MQYTKLIVLFCVVLINGCTAALVGGGAAGGYAVAKDDRTIGQITDDGIITAAVNTAYLQDDIIKTMKIDVDTHRNVVTLHGAVSSYKQKRRAVQLAGSIKHVKRVISKLVILE